MSEQISLNPDKLTKQVQSDFTEDDSQHVEPLENINRIQQRLAIQRIQEHQKFIAHQEKLTKHALIARSRESNIILENKQLNIEPFQQSMSNQVCFPLFDEIHGENELWKLISKNILSSSSYLSQPPIQPSSHITQLVSQPNSSEALEQQQSFESIPPVSNTITTTHLNATSEHPHPTSHQQSQYHHPQGTMISKPLKSVANKDKHPSAFALLRESRSVNEALSQEYLASALRSGMKEKRKMRRIKLSSLSKDMRDMIFHDDQLQLISKEVGTQKIDLNKPIVIIETISEDIKSPSYNPSLNKVRNYSANSEDRLAQSETNLDKANSRVRRKSEINMLEKMFADREKTVQNHKNHNIFQNGGGNSQNEGKSSARLRIGKSPRNFEMSKRDGGTREIRRKSCHCSECGDLTKKQICNYLFVREVDKLIRHRVLSHHSPRMQTLPPQIINNLIAESPRNHNHNHSSFLVTNRDNPNNTNSSSNNQWINSFPVLQQANNNNHNSSNHQIMGQSQSLNSSQQQQQQSSSMLLSSSQHFQNPSSHAKTKQQPLVRKSSLLQSQQQQPRHSLMKSSTNPHQLKQSYTISEQEEHSSQVASPQIPLCSQVKINMKALHEQFKYDLDNEEGIKSPFFTSKASSRLIATTPQPGNRHQVQSNVQSDLPECGYGNLKEQSKKYFRYHPNRTFLIRMEKKNQEESIKQKQLSHSSSHSPNYLFSRGSFHQRNQSTQLQQEQIWYPSRGKISDSLLAPLGSTYGGYKGRETKLNISQDNKANIMPKSKKEQRLQIKQAKAVFALNCAKSAYLKTLSKDTMKKSNVFPHPKAASSHIQRPLDAYLQKVGEVKIIRNNSKNSAQNVGKNSRSSSGNLTIQKKRQQLGIQKNLSVSEVFFSDSISQSTFGSSSGFSKKSPTNSNNNNDSNPYRFCNDYVGS